MESQCATGRANELTLCCDEAGHMGIYHRDRAEPVDVIAGWRVPKECEQRPRTLYPSSPQDPDGAPPVGGSGLVDPHRTHPCLIQELRPCSCVRYPEPRVRRGEQDHHLRAAGGNVWGDLQPCDRSSLCVRGTRSLTLPVVDAQRVD